MSVRKQKAVYLVGGAKSVMVLISQMHVRHYCKINLKIDFSPQCDLNKIMKTLCRFCLVSFRYCRTI